MGSREQSDESVSVCKDVLAAGRATCYKARDAFYQCMDKTQNITPNEVASVGLLYPTFCKQARAQYEKSCRSTWVKHFDRQYAAKRRLKRLLDIDVSKGGRPLTLPENPTSPR